MIKILPMAMLTHSFVFTAADTEVIGAEAPVPDNIAPGHLEGEGQGSVPPHLSSRRRFEIADCADLDQRCAYWARQGACSFNTYVATYCKASCGSCFRQTTGTQTSNKEVDIQEKKRVKELLGEKWGTGQPAGQPAAQWNTQRGQRLTGTDRITNTNEQLNTERTTHFGNAAGDPSLFNGRFNRRLIVDVGDEYLGCFDSLRIPDNRIFSNTVPINAEGLYACRQGCAGLGYQMYGFECPRANLGQVHCECVRSMPSKNLEKFDCLSRGAQGSCDGSKSYNGVNLGSAHRMTVYGMWRPGQNPSVGDEYKGCYDSSQINDNRSYKDSVAITASGLADCRAGCIRQGYHMYGFECPRGANNQVHCECVRGTPRDDLLRPDCHVSVGTCNGRHTFNGFNLGTANRMTVYRVQNAVAGNRW